MNSGINYILFHQLLEQTSSRLSPDVSNIINIYITQQKWYSTFYENMSKSLSPKPRQNHGTQGIFHPIPELPQEWHEHPLHKELLQRRCFDLSDGWKGCFWWSLVILYYLYICCFFFTCFLSSDVIHLFFKHIATSDFATSQTHPKRDPTNSVYSLFDDSCAKQHWTASSNGQRVSLGQSLTSQPSGFFRCRIHPIWGAQMAPHGSRSKIATRVSPGKKLKHQRPQVRKPGSSSEKKSSWLFNGRRGCWNLGGCILVDLKEMGGVY